MAEPAHSSRARAGGGLLSARMPSALRGAPALIPCLLAVGVFVAWAASEAGYPTTTWLPGALFLLGVLVVAAVALGFPLRLSRPTVVALGLMGLFCIWNFASIAWADAKGDAWDGANRTLVYMLIFALFACWPWRSRPAAVLLGAFALGIAAVGAVELIRMSAASNPSDFFVTLRFAEPAGYPNANAALWLSGMWPALFLASRRETPWPLRGLMLASAGLLLELAVLVQSRGAAVALPIVVVLYLVLVPNRLRGVLVMVPVALATAAALAPLLSVYDAGRLGHDLTDPIHSAAAAIWLSTAALFLVGIALGFADRRVEVSRSTGRTVGAGLLALAVVVLLLGGVVAARAIGNPGTWLDDRWADFKSGYSTDLGSSRFTGSLGSNRYDFWRVSLDQFSASPVGGAGSDNFAIDYVRERRSGEEPLYPHSLLFRLPGQTGLVGTLLFGGFLVSALLAAAPVRTSRRRFRAAVAAAAIVSFAYWFVHGSLDWFWEFPALAGPAFAWLGLAAGLGSGVALGRAPARDPARAPLPRAPLLAAGGLVAVVAALSFALPWMAARNVDAAASGWAADPQQAYHRLDRAAGLNPLSDEPYLVAGAIANRLGDRARARSAFEDARRRTPDGWSPYLQLGLLDALAGHRRDALRQLDHARTLNPRDDILALVERRVRRGKRVSIRQVEKLYLRRVMKRL